MITSRNLPPDQAGTMALHILGLGWIRIPDPEPATSAISNSLPLKFPAPIT
jgi:hypothetical protein